MPEVFGKDSEVLASGKATMERILRTANADLDYTRDFQGTASMFIRNNGAYDTRDWVPRLARGYIGALQGENPNTPSAVVRGFQEPAGNLLASWSESGSKQAVQMFGGFLEGAAVEQFGVPVDLARPAIQLAQTAVLDGLGSVASSILASSGAALGPLTGGLSIVGGGLLSLALGSLFGDEKLPVPPMPPEKVRTIRKPSTIVEMDAVWEELFTTVVRWRKMQVRQDAEKTNYFYLPEGYWSGTRVTANMDWKTPARDVKAHGPLGASGGVLLAAQEAWLGPPIPWTVDGLDNYRFPHDALAQWVGYNRNLSLATQQNLEKQFTLNAAVLAKSPFLRPYEPYFGTIGWAEWIVAGVIAQIQRSYLPFNSATNIGYPWKGQAWAFPNLIGILREGKRRFAGHRGPRTLRGMAKNWATDPVGALALTTEIVRASMGVGEGLQRQGRLAEEQTNALRIEGEDWRRQTQQSILAAVTGRASEDARANLNRMQRDLEKGSVIRKAGLPILIIAGTLGATALGAWIASRRRH